ncbi:contact-dependent growth inhibition system immunity protein [Emticicia agri]|uniref:Uncharacterized protein n=1 Tax=Emticicia agri TaxID=2492393 RepID=A0A4Q5LWY9_9BACT|nr:contact-dependent growth inhibition system immunity protein [Emticicia agri]RYU94268.1 hypothetical protein EWM59_17775 [Emticicia agri]
MENNYQSLFELDNSLKLATSEPTPLVQNHNALLIKKLKDLRFMIGQKTGLAYLVPMAIQVLQENIFAEGDFYEGDLLQNVLSIDKVFWTKNNDLYLRLKEIIQQDFDMNKIETTDEIKAMLQSLADNF